MFIHSLEEIARERQREFLLEADKERMLRRLRRATVIPWQKKFLTKLGSFLASRGLKLKTTAQNGI
jgi:hypothetical protein